MIDEIRRIALAGSAPDETIDVKNLPLLVRYVEDFLDPTWLSARLTELDDWVRQNSEPMLQAKLLHCPLRGSYLVAAIAASRFWSALAAKDGWSDPPAGPKRLIQIAVTLSVLELHAGSFFDAEARDHLRQRLQATDDGNLFSAIHEAATFAYLVRKGLKPEPFFLRKASREEIRLMWQGQTVPVQCKVKMSGAGRFISRRAFTTLAGMIARDIKSIGRPVAIRIRSTDKRISALDIDFLRQRAKEAAQACRSKKIGPLLHQSGSRMYAVTATPLQDTFSIEDASLLIQNFNCHTAFLLGNPKEDDGTYQADALIGIDVQSNEDTWRTLRESIKAAANQLQDGPPGLAAIHYVDPVTEQDGILPRQLPFPVAMVDRLIAHPQLAGILISAESAYDLPGDVRPGPVWTYLVDGRTPIDFPLRRTAQVIDLARYGIA